MRCHLERQAEARVSATQNVVRSEPHSLSPALNLLEEFEKLRAAVGRVLCTADLLASTLVEATDLLLLRSAALDTDVTARRYML